MSILPGAKTSLRGWILRGFDVVLIASLWAYVSTAAVMAPLFDTHGAVVANHS